MFAIVARASLTSTARKAAFSTATPAMAAAATTSKPKDVLVNLALEEVRKYKPTEVKITDEALLKKFTAPTPPPVAKVEQVTKEELEAYVKGE